MKRIINVLVLTGAINFLLVALGGAFLFQSSHMDRDKFTAVKKLLFETSQPTTAPATQAVATSGPADHLQQLLAVASGRPAGEQVEFLRQTFDGEMAELDRRQRELQDQQHQIELARDQIQLDRTKLEIAQKQLADAQDQQTKLASDKGFQDTLELYNALPAKNVKAIFITLSDEVMMQYLQAMDAKIAAKIAKEFKTPDETARIQKVLEKMRLAQQGATPSGAGTEVAPGGSTAPGGPQAALPRQ